MAVPTHPSRKTSNINTNNGLNNVTGDSVSIHQETYGEVDNQLPHKSVMKLKNNDSHSGMKKRGSFQITNVTIAKSNHNEDLDSFDDLDETHTEEMSYEICDTSKIDIDPSLTEELAASVTTITDHDDVFRQGKALQEADTMNISKANSDMHSRFKVVKIESKEPFVRGRWTCLDYRNPPAEKALEKNTDEIGSGNSSTTSSINYVHGIDDPARDPLLAISSDGHTIVEPQPINLGISHISNEPLSSTLVSTTENNSLTNNKLNSSQIKSLISQSVHSTPTTVMNPSSQSTSITPVSTNTMITEHSSDYIPSGQEAYLPPQGQEYMSHTDYESSHHPAVTLCGEIPSQTIPYSKAAINASSQVVPSEYSTAPQQPTSTRGSVADFNKSLEALTALNSSKISASTASLATQANSVNASSHNTNNVVPSIDINKELNTDYVQRVISDGEDDIDEFCDDDEDSVTSGSSTDDTDSKQQIVTHGMNHAPLTTHSFLAPPLLEMVATMQPGSQLISKDNGDER